LVNPGRQTGGHAQEASSIHFGQKLGVARGDCLMLFDEMEDLLPADNPDRMHKGWICDSLESTGIPTIWTTNSLQGVDPAILRRFTFTLEVPVPPRRLRKRLLDELLMGYSLTPGWLDRVASLDCLTPAMTQQMAALAQSLGTKAVKLEAALDLWLTGRLKAMYRPPLPPIKTVPAFRCELMNASLEPRSLIKGLKKSVEGRLCLHGPPGTGKSAFAKYLAEELVLRQCDNYGFRGAQMFQNKAQTAENGVSFSRAVTKCWSIWVPPFGRVGKRSSVALRLLARTRPLPARRALRSTTSQLAELAVITLTEY